MGVKDRCVTFPNLLLLTHSPDLEGKNWNIQAQGCGVIQLAASGAGDGERGDLGEILTRCSAELQQIVSRHGRLGNCLAEE